VEGEVDLDTVTPHPEMAPPEKFPDGIPIESEEAPEAEA